MLRQLLSNLGGALPNSRSLCRRQVAVQTIVGDMRKNSRSRSPRCCDFAEQSRVSLRRAKSLFRCQVVLQAVVSDMRKNARSRAPRCCDSGEQPRGLYINQGRFADAEPLFKRALAITGKDTRFRSPRCRDFAEQSRGFYQAQSRYADAEPLFKRVIGDNEKNAFGPDHPDVAAVVEQPSGALPNPRSLHRRRTAVQAIVGNPGEEYSVPITPMLRFR